jgi:hypothetical protein
MFTPFTLRVSAIIAMLLSASGLAISLLTMQYSGMFLLGAISWLLLLWAGFLGFQLAGYKLYKEEYKKVGLRIYLIIVAFGLFLIYGLVVGIVLSVGLLATLWGLKRNYDEWVPSAETTDAEGA